MATTQGTNPGLNTHHELPIADAATMQAAFVTAFPHQPVGGFFFRTGIDHILAQTDCIGIRYYFILENNLFKVIMLGVEKQTYNDMTDIIIGNAQTDPPFGNGVTITTLDQVISLATAVDLTVAFQSANADQLPGGFFFRSIFDYFIDVSDVTGIRYKFGMNSNGKLKVIINPVNSDFQDMNMFNVTGQKIKGEVSNGGGGGGSPLMG